MPEEIFDEIKTIGRRRRGSGGGGSFQSFQSGGGIGGGGVIAAAVKDLSSAGEAMRPLEEIIVTAKKIPPKPPPSFLGITRLERNLGAARAASLNAMLDRSAIATTEKLLAKPSLLAEVKVIAKRIPKAGLGGPLLFVADIVGQLSDVFSQRRLDEVGFLATRAVDAPPDTPVQTIQPEVIDEIVVRAKRPTARPLPFPIGGRDFTGIPQNFPSPRAGFPSQVPQFTFTKVREPAIKQPPKRIPTAILGQVEGGAEPRNIPRPTTRVVFRQSPRSAFLTTPKSTRLTDPLTTVGTALLGSPITATAPNLANAGCNCRKKKEKERKKCFKGLVKQGRFASKDKMSKWVEIDCRTKREIPKLGIK